MPADPSVSIPELEHRITAQKAALDILRPLAQATLAVLDHWYDIELTYTSNALEGNTLTRSETAIVLEKGITVSGKPLKDHLEATGHAEALRYIRHLATQPEPVRELDLRNMHRLVLERIDPEEAGRYSRHQRMIAGSPLLLPSPAEIPPLMADLAAWLITSPLTPQTAFEAHQRLVTIHPFSDGNGRTARLLMNLLLLKAGYPPVVITPEDRPAYHDALQTSQVDHNHEPYQTLLLTRLSDSLARYLQIVQRASK